ncbi:glycosyltransferase family 4 protein [Thalassolituus sp. UBA3500]|uniref:glycosyltransferase family 4 protein n=1 Tax=Thalassolituus sp. UBA3500 TaxID=1947664 RepID=UPI0007D0291E|nr:glycosyltransferase family 4 protein [Thalassolituus sp. UBA3500]KZZ12876.1 hypothetical protein A3746_01830 [Oleibacter sp. HI0075]MBN59269.1 glycosyltransferase family 1 protein [Oceanospirillaceae bacterium]|tara:strand:- start:2565 stop:3677 length:1113 start_codon:yes stop_codon:yes gene_type:complete
MKHVVIATHEYPPRIGGAGIVARDLATSLSQLDGYYVSVITQYDASLLSVLRKRVIIDSDSGFKIVRIPVFRNTWFVSYPYIFRRVVPTDCDLLVYNDFAISYLTKSSDFPYVHYIHGKEKYLEFSGFLKSTILSFDKIFRRSIRDSYRVVCVSSFIKGWLLNLGLPQDLSKVKVLENHIDKSLFYRTTDIPPEYQLSGMEGKTVLITASRLVEGKGYARMLKIFNEIVQDGDKEIHWVIAGDGDYRKEFENDISKYGLQNRLTLLGRVDRKSLLYYYAQADLFWLLSDFEEAYPLVYKEAIACGLPAIGNDLGGVSEVVSHGVDGYVCSTDEDVKHIIGSRSYEVLRNSPLSDEFDKLSFAREFIRVVS